LRIAIFDYRVTSRNPAGSCHLAILRALAREHEFTVFSVQFENPDPERIVWVRVPVPLRPMALLFLAFHLFSPALYIWHCLKTRKSFDLVQSVESNLGFGGLIYAHFSHTNYLNTGQPVSSGLRGWLRWFDHALHAVVEPYRFRLAEHIVVPSRGLQQELRTAFPFSGAKIEVIANPIPVHQLERPASFDRDSFRGELALHPADVVCVFCALGHFERKGLPLLIEALRSPTLDSVKLVVVGGEPDLLKTYKVRASQAGVESKIRFVGFQQDARPYLWSANAFVLPSAYETFSLAAYEAAAAGLPVIAPALNGICDLLVDGETGFLIDPTASSITSALERLLQTPPDELINIGARAQKAASSYSIERFTENWQRLYQRWPYSTRKTLSNSKAHSANVSSWPSNEQS